MVPSGKGGTSARGPASPVIMTWGRAQVGRLFRWLRVGAVGSSVMWNEWHPFVSSWYITSHWFEWGTGGGLS